MRLSSLNAARRICYVTIALGNWGVYALRNEVDNHYIYDANDHGKPHSGHYLPMSENFINLVSQANPAARQNYQQQNSGYPPSANSPYGQQSPQILDPFFDDEDDMPDSAFHMGNPAPMQSQESGLPLRAGAAPMAGVSKTSMGDGMPQGWTFDAEEPEMRSGGAAFDGSAAFPGVKTPKDNGRKQAKKRGWKWPWQKEKELTGERIVALNNHPMNSEYVSNFVSTSKYNPVTFLPKFFGGEYIY